MYFEIINTEPIVPKCNFCDRTTDQMARFHVARGHGITFYICSSCGRFVKEALNKWPELKSTDYIDVSEGVFNSKNIDKLVEENKEKAAFIPYTDPDDEMKSDDYTNIP